jgi:hypothetical protein
MTETLQQIIKEEVLKLPKENQEAIASLDWVKTTEEMGAKYLFDEITLNDFQVETLLVLLGLKDPDFFAINIENEVGISKKEAEKITGEVFEKIFTPINNKLIELIEKSENIKNAGFNKNLNFILSGGDYSAFQEKRKVDTDQNSLNTTRKSLQENLEKTLGIKNKLVI